MQSSMLIISTLCETTSERNFEVMLKLEVAADTAVGLFSKNVFILSCNGHPPHKLPHTSIHMRFCEMNFNC